MRTQLISNGHRLSYHLSYHFTRPSAGKQCVDCWARSTRMQACQTGLGHAVPELIAEITRIQACQKALGVRADLDEVRDHAIVKVLAAQVRVARRCLDLPPSMNAILKFTAGHFGWTQIDAPRQYAPVLQNSLQRWSHWLDQVDAPRQLPPVLNNAGKLDLQPACDWYYSNSGVGKAHHGLYL